MKKESSEGVNWRIKKKNSKNHSPILRIERRTVPKKSIDRIRIDKTRKFSSKGSSSPFRNLTKPSPKLKIDSSKEETSERSNRLLKFKQSDKRIFGGKLKSEGSQDKMRFRKMKPGQSPGIRRVFEKKKFQNFSKAK